MSRGPKKRRRSRASKVAPFTAPEARASENALTQYLFNLRSAEVTDKHRPALAFTIAAAEAALRKVQARVEEHGDEAKLIKDDLQDPDVLLGGDDRDALLGGR